jgi:hypothetical protein
MPVTSALGKLRQVDCKFKASLGYRETLSQKWGGGQEGVMTQVVYHLPSKQEGKGLSLIPSTTVTLNGCEKQMPTYCIRVFCLFPHILAAWGLSEFTCTTARTPSLSLPLCCP